MPPSLGAPPQGAKFRLGLSLRKIPFLFLCMAIRVFPTHVIPAPTHAIPAPTHVIPAKAGISPTQDFPCASRLALSTECRLSAASYAIDKSTNSSVVFTNISPASAISSRYSRR